MNARVPKTKFLGGVLLIVGTSIGGGMLALPIAVGGGGLLYALVFLALCWMVMTAGALLTLEVNLRLPAGSNMVSMAKSTLGLPGQIVAWFTYLLLLYALLAAYISGGSDVLHDLLHNMKLDLPKWVTVILFTAVFSTVTYGGIRAVDYVNRVFMFGKLGIYLLLVCLILPKMNQPLLHVGSLFNIMGSMMILITAFGFAAIVPSLRTYFSEDVHALRKIIVLGSFIPLLCYIIWVLVIMGVVSRLQLVGLNHSDAAISGLIHALTNAVSNDLITVFFVIFTAICVVTAFLAISLCLFDFLADGLTLKKQGHQGQWILVLTLLPPLALVLLKPGVYLHALRYAGTLCIVLHLLLPVCMAWRGRQQTQSSADSILLPGGQAVLSLLGLMVIVLLGIGIL